MAKNNEFIRNLRKTMEEPEEQSSYEDVQAKLDRMFNNIFGTIETAENEEDDEQTEDSFGNGQQGQEDEEEEADMDNMITLNDEDEEVRIEFPDLTITLYDEDGEEVQFEFFDLVEYEGEQYVVLFPVGEDSGMATILKVENSDGDSDEETYVSVSEDTRTAVLEIIKEKFKEEFGFVD